MNDLNRINTVFIAYCDYEGNPNSLQCFQNTKISFFYNIDIILRVEQLSIFLHNQYLCR